MTPLGKNCADVEIEILNDMRAFLCPPEITEVDEDELAECETNPVQNDNLNDNIIFVSPAELRGLQRNSSVCDVASLIIQRIHEKLKCDECLSSFTTAELSEMSIHRLLDDNFDVMPLNTFIESIHRCPYISNL